MVGRPESKHKSPKVALMVYFRGVVKMRDKMKLGKEARGFTGLG